MSSMIAPEWLMLEDGPLIAVNKPAGLLTEGAPDGVPSMVGEVKSWLRDRYGKEGGVYLGIPHRLDRATSGLLVFTRNSKAAARVASQFETREVAKTYWALLEQPPEQAEGLLVDWMRKLPEDARSEIALPGSAGAKEARLQYRTLLSLPVGTLVEVDLLTGRMHQIRLQFASRGCPIVGDTKYGARVWRLAEDGLTGPPGSVCDAEGVPSAAPRSFDLRCGLHARRLSLFHPVRYDRLTLTAPLPPWWGFPESIGGESTIEPQITLDPTTVRVREERE